MKYIDVYKSRISHLGITPQERAYQSGILEFRRYLKYNQHTEHTLRLDGQEDFFSGVILTDKEDENRVSQILLVKVLEDGGPEIKPGNLIWWGDDVQPWLIYRVTTSSYQPHQKFYMVRCNYEIKWVDEEGILQSSWIYLLGHKDSKVKDNFRTWNNLITPQPNKYINIILPFRKIKQGTEIIVLDEVWYLVDDDRNSVPGISFMSFTETNLNEQRDDVEQSLANIDTLAQWEIILPSHRYISPRATFKVNYSILKNGIEDTSVIPEMAVTGNFSLSDGVITAGRFGTGVLTLSYGGKTATQILKITDEWAEVLIITGDEKVRVTKTAEYTINLFKDAIFSIEEEGKEVTQNELASLETIDETHCRLIANTNNKVGIVKLKANADGQVAYKDIEIVSLWQVI